MFENKILFAGPVGVGVTTAIKTISDIEPTVKQNKITDAEANVVTFELDYGVLKLETGDQLFLYGAPDKETTKLVGDSLNKNCIGLIILINNIEGGPIANMLHYLETYSALVDKEAIAVGLTRYDESPTPDIHEFHTALREQNLNIPVFSVNVHDKNDIITIIKALLYSLDSGVK